jgi:hypothetical protein
VALAACLAALVLAPETRAAPGDPVVFSAIGDVPYDADEISEFAEHVENHNRYSPSAFLIHLGDILSGSESCQEARYQTVAEILKTSEVPAFIVPGDNEWVGCSNPAQGWAWWEEHLLGLEQDFCGIWPVDAQPERPENFAFVRDAVLFVGLNNVSGGPSSVEQASADWVDAAFAAHGASARAAVVMAQKEPDGDLFDAVVANGRAFAKPVLYLHGNGHAWEHDTGYFGEPNLLRVQVDRGDRSEPPVQVTVTPTGLFLFDRDPWPPGTPEVSRAPCGAAPSLSIDDLFVTEGQEALFTVTLTGGNGSAVSVGYTTVDGSARAGSDYAGKSGLLSFGGATTQQQVRVATTQDPTVEPGESFTLRLSGASGAAIGKADGTAVIVDDDTAPPPPPPPPPPPSGGPSLRQVVTGGATGASAVSTSGPVGAESGSLYLAAVSFKPHVAVASVSGLGLAWTPVRQHCAGRSQTGIALFQAQGSPSAAGTVTASLASAPSSAVIAVARYAGAASGGGLGSPVSANTLGLAGGCSGGSDGSGYAFGLTTSAADSLVFVAAAMRSKDHLPGAGYAEIAQAYGGSGGSSAGVALAERRVSSPASVSVDGGFSAAVDWAVVGVEIRAGSAPAPGPVSLGVTSTSGGQVALDPPGGSYSAGTLVTLTAVPDPGFAFAGWGGALSGTANPATLVMDQSRSVSASFAAAPPGPGPGPGGTFTFPAVADAMVKSTSPTKNYGAETTLRVKTDDTAWRSFVRFDVSGLAGSVTRATLRLWVTDGSREGGRVFPVASAWSETGLTWQSAPALAGTPLAVAGAVADDTWVELDVTAAVAGNGAHAFGLLSQLSSSTYFSSREGVHAPELVVTTAGP